MQITERTEEDIPVVSITGDVDLETSPQLREFLKPKSSKKTPLLLLDFSGVNYIDSGGLGTLVALHIAAHNAGGTIKLANLNKRVGDLMQVTKLLTVFEVHNSEYEALEAFRKVA